MWVFIYFFVVGLVGVFVDVCYVVLLLLLLFLCFFFSLFAVVLVLFFIEDFLLAVKY